MRDPTRLSQQPSSELERTLLRAGRPAAPAGAKRRALLVASSAAAAANLAVTQAAAEGPIAAIKAGTIALMKLLKWTGAIGMASGLAASVAALHSASVRSAGMNSPMPSVSAPAPEADRGATSVTAAVSPPLPTGLDNHVEAVASGVSGKAQVPARGLPRAMGPRGPSHASGARLESGPSAPALGAELAALDEAQAALDTGDTARALQILDAYEQRFPRGAMVPEATVLRIETLVKAGQRQAAKRTADGWLAQSPDSPYARRIRTLLSNP